MTHPSDIAGLSERLRRLGPDNSGFRKIGIEAATALDSLTARVKELEAERDEARAAAGLGCDAHNGGPHSVMSDGSYKFCTACGETIRTPSLRERARAAESRALRAEQQRDEAYERAANVAETVYPSSYDTGVVQKQIAAAIRRLAATSDPKETTNG